MATESSQTAPLAGIQLLLRVDFLDEEGEDRIVRPRQTAHAYAAGAERYWGDLHNRDPYYRRHYDLVGANGLSLSALTLLGIGGGGTTTLLLACTAHISMKAVRKLVKRTRKAGGAAYVEEYPAYLNFGSAEGRSAEAASLSVEAAQTERGVCIQRIGFTLPVGDAQRVASQMALYRAQLSAP